MNDLTSAELNPLSSDLELESKRVRLNLVYDEFVKKFGYLNENKNRKDIKQDLYGAKVLGLEKDFEKEITPRSTKMQNIEPKPAQAKKAQIFFERTLNPKKELIITNAKEALIASINQKGGLDLHFIRDHFKTQSLETTIKELLEQKLIYKDHKDNGGYILANDYLSGNVKRKLKEVKEAIKEGVEGLEANVKDLELIIPKDLKATEIMANINSPWIPTQYLEEFLMELSANHYEKQYGDKMTDYQLDNLKEKIKVEHLNGAYGKWFFTINKYFENYFYILDYKMPKPETQIKLEEKIHSITFENVSFSYPNSKLIFENFNLSLHSDKIYALVGRNASGKTTLIKLLLGFYTPNSGQIIINNKYSLQDLELNSYHQQMSAIFQDFSLYAGYSIDDNLFMQNNPTREQLKQKREMLKSFDENFQNCLNDYSNALFGTQYNGIDFSLGQKQRIATIRAFLKPSHCVVLDEPSSTIDPIIEKEFLDFIFKKSHSKMALIITHRMNSVKQADEIVVLDQGKLIEQGNFETLMKKQGLFYELFLKQQY